MAAYISRPASEVIQSGVSASMRPSLRRMARSGSSRSLHQSMSVVSPKVQHMAMPAPLSFSAAEWGSTGTSTPKTGEVTVVPNSGLKRSSSGWATRATQAGSSSGRVVSTQTSAVPPGPSSIGAPAALAAAAAPASAMWKAMRW